MKLRNDIENQISEINLMGGNYRVCLNIKPIIYNINFKNEEYLEKFLILQTEHILRSTKRPLVKVKLLLKRIYSRLFLNFSIYDNNEKNNYYSVVMLTGKHLNRYKYIDFESSLIVTQYEKKSKFTRVMESIECFSNYFPCGDCSFDAQELLMYENLHDLYPSSEWQFNEWYNISEQYLYSLNKYLIDYEPTRISTEYFVHTVATSLEEYSNFYQVEEFIKLLKKMSNSYKNIYCSNVHGDLDHRNVIITIEGNVIFIDWENSRVDFVFYDLIHLYVSEFNVFGNINLLKNYKEGKFDELLINFKWFDMISPQGKINSLLLYISSTFLRLEQENVLDKNYVNHYIKLFYKFYYL